jgi:NADP-dependent 3-hydroxy acid dehydrogenase YdfG
MESKKTVLITGASKGLGKSMSELFSLKGWQVIDFSKSTGVDISNYQAVKNAVATIEKIDLLINNAAIFTMREFTSSTVIDIDQIIDTNLKGAMYVTREALFKLIDGSKIIFINSVAGTGELINQSIYSASKHGLSAFANIIAQELRPRNIKVSSIYPGGINTTLWNADNPYPCGSSSEAMPPEAIADLVYYIASSPYDIDYKSIKLFPTVEWH